MLAVGRDYRIGLVAGVILAGVALVWVTTRPSRGPQPPPAREEVSPEARNPVISQSEGSASQVNQPGFNGHDRAESNPPASVVGNPSAGSPDPMGREKTEADKTGRFHVVRPGETLSGIAQQYYGSASSWRKILAANEKIIKDANKIAPGTKLTIPD